MHHIMLIKRDKQLIAPHAVKLPTGRMLYFERVTSGEQSYWCLWLGANTEFTCGTQLRMFDDGTYEVWYVCDDIERRLDAGA